MKQQRQKKKCERYCDVLRNRLKLAIKKSHGSSSSGMYLQRDTAGRASCSQSHHEINSGFKMRGVTPSAILTRFGTHWYSPLFTPKRLCTWKSLQIRRGSRGGGAQLAGTATKRLLLPRNLYLGWTLVEVCRIWWGLHWHLSLYCTYFCPKSLYIIFTVFIWMTLVPQLN